MVNSILIFLLFFLFYMFFRRKRLVEMHFWNKLLTAKIIFNDLIYFRYLHFINRKDYQFLRHFQDIIFKTSSKASFQASKLMGNNIGVNSNLANVAVSFLSVPYKNFR